MLLRGVARRPGARRSVATARTLGRGRHFNRARLGYCLLEATSSTGALLARIRRLAREIRRTNSRVSALRSRMVPGLLAETRAIAFALEPRELEDRYRFKRVKALRVRRGR